MWDILFTAAGTPSKPRYNGGQNNEITCNCKLQMKHFPWDTT